MQVVRNTGSWLLRSWAGPGMTRLVAVAPAQTIHTGAPRLENEAAQQKIQKEAAPSPFSIYPPAPGQESSLRWAGMRFEEVPVAHIKATHNNTQIQVVSATNMPLARTSCVVQKAFEMPRRAGASQPRQQASPRQGSESHGKGSDPHQSCSERLGTSWSAIKGLTMGCLEVISVTDNTPVPHNGCRPRKARRL